MGAPGARRTPADQAGDGGRAAWSVVGGAVMDGAGRDRRACPTWSRGRTGCSPRPTALGLGALRVLERLGRSVLHGVPVAEAPGGRHAVFFVLVEDGRSGGPRWRR